MTLPHRSILFILVYFVSVFFSDFDTRKWKATLTLFRRVTIRKITRTRIVLLIIIIRIFAANFSRRHAINASSSPTHSTVVYNLHVHVHADIPNVDTTASNGHMTCHAQLKTRVMKCFVFIATRVKICRLLLCN